MGMRSVNRAQRRAEPLSHPSRGPTAVSSDSGTDSGEVPFAALCWQSCGGEAVSAAPPLPPPAAMHGVFRIGRCHLYAYTHRYKC